MRPSQCHLRLLGLPFLTVICILLGARGVATAMVDLNGNGMSDVWELMYGVYGADPNADPDGDGFSNFQEAIAGTDPLNSHSYPHIPIVVYTPTNFFVTMTCALGKVYQLQSLTDLGSTNWVVETNLEALAGTNITLSAGVTTGMKFYRVAVADVDSD